MPKTSKPRAEEQIDQSTSTETQTAGENTGRARLEHVPPAQFAALRDELGLSNKQVAEAIGRTLSRVSELTYSKGASINTWNSYEQAVREFAANMPADESGDQPSA